MRNNNDSNEKPLPKPTDFDQMYPGRFIKAGDFGGKQVTLRISAVDIAKLVSDKGPQVKGIVSFDRTEKQWCINKTNGECVKAMFGRNPQAWIGKRVTLFAGDHNGEPCIRVWGSPDIDADFEVLIQLPRKFPFRMTMHRTGPARAAAAPAQRQEPAQRTPAPVVEREPGADDEGLPSGSGGDGAELSLAPDEPYNDAASRALDLQLVGD